MKKRIAGIIVLPAVGLFVALHLGCAPKKLDQNGQTREAFMARIVATGDAGVSHQKVNGKVEYRATATEPYVDASGRTCRTVHLVQIEKGVWKDMGDHFYCRENGQWVLDDG